MQGGIAFFYKEGKPSVLRHQGYAPPDLCRFLRLQHRGQIA